MPPAEQPRLETERLDLAPFCIEDAAELFTIRGDARAMEFWDRPPGADLTTCQAAARYMLNEMARGEAMHWTIRLKDSDRFKGSAAFVGVCDLSELASETPDIGFMLAPSAWGQGYAAEAAGRLMDYARERGIGRLKGRIHAGNERSARLLERLGFREQERVPDWEIRPGVVRECVIYAVDL